MRAIKIMSAMAGLVALCGLVGAQQTSPRTPAVMQMGDSDDGQIRDGKPITTGWTALFDGKSLRGWKGEPGYWQVKDGVIVGTQPGHPHHHYLFSDRDYSDFELHADVKMTGYNSGVCVRIQPKTYDDVPGYQVDMGDGYWGCLWDEHHRQTKIFDYPKEQADKILHPDDWNHYFVRMAGTHVTAYLNGVKTFDGEDPDGYKSGPFGFQLCHGGTTTASFRNLWVKTRFDAPQPDGTTRRVNAPPTKGTAPPVPSVVTP